MNYVILEKAKSYTRVRRGKFERVKGYVGKPKVLLYGTGDRKIILSSWDEELGRLPLNLKELNGIAEKVSKKFDINIKLNRDLETNRSFIRKKHLLDPSSRPEIVLGLVGFRSEVIGTLFHELGHLLTRNKVESKAWDIGENMRKKFVKFRPSEENELKRMKGTWLAWYRDKNKMKRGYWEDTAYPIE